MAVTRVKLLQNGREGEYRARDNALRRYTNVYRVEVSNPADGPAVILAAASVPALFSVYSGGNDADTGALVVGMRARKIGPLLGELEIDYSTTYVDSARGGEQDPTLRAPDIRWSFTRHTTHVETDSRGSPYVNSAGTPLDPPPEKDELRPHLTISRWEALFNPSLALDYQDAINEAPFLGAPAGWAKCEGISAQLDPQQGANVWKVTYEFEFRKGGHKHRVLDAGLYRIDPNTLKPVEIVGDKGGTPSEPVLLNGKGGLLKDARTTTVGATGVADAVVIVTDGSVFPDPVILQANAQSGEFFVRIEGEVLKVTNRVLDVLTVQRGQQNTAAAGHAGGSTVKMEPFYIEYEPFERKDFSVFGF